MKKFVKGMHKDSERVDQPEGTLRDALNANLYYSKGAIVNEQGTIRLGTHLMHIIGAVPLLNNQVISFCYVDPNPQIALAGPPAPNFSPENSGIVLTNTRTNESRILYMSPNLNFQKSHPIVGEFKVDSKNEIIVYFTDNYYTEEDTPEGKAIKNFNPPRAFNVTRQLEYLKTDGSQGAYTKLYDSDESFSVSKLSLFAKVGKHSIIEKASIFEGGVLVSGAYHLALCYSDENFLETDYFVVSNPVYIFQSQEQQYPADVITGCQAGSQTTKAIKFQVKTFYNNNYKFLQPTIIQRVGNAEFAYKLERIELANNGSGLTMDVVFTGNEEKSTSSVEDIIIDNVGYLTAKSITQLDDRLYLGNLKSRKDIGFQRYANNIKLETVVKDYNRFDIRMFDVVSLNKGYAQMLLPYAADQGNSGAQFGIGQTFVSTQYGSGSSLGQQMSDDLMRRTYFEHLYGLLKFGSGVVTGLQDDIDQAYSLTDKVAKGYKDFRFSYKQKTFRRGDVYAFYISFVLKDGTETYAYHIPGREPLKAKIAPPGVNPSAAPKYLSERDGFSSSENKWRDIRNSFGFYPSEIAVNDPNARIYQYVDSSMRDNMVPDFINDGQNYDGVTKQHNGFSFWENINERYPESDDFVGGLVTAQGVGSTSSTFDLRGKRVRHHKMPSNHNPRSSYLRMHSGFLSDEDQPRDIFDKVLGQLNSTGYYTSHQSVVPEEYTNTVVSNLTGFDNTYKESKIVSRDPIRLLGIQLKNIKIPKHILKKVQGYKVYYAKRKPEDKIVAGQSIAVPSHPRYASVPTQNKLLARRGPYKNAFYLYGGLEHTDANAMLISADWKRNTVASQTGQDSRYVGHPVFTFHDFTMLRKRPTLENITHVSCQAGITFRHFTGGPNIFEKPVSRTQINDGSGASKSGKGGAKDLTIFPSLGWIHPDLGNTTDFDKDGQVVDITDNFVDLQEDVSNPYGNSQADGSKPKKKGFLRRVFGKIIGKDEDDGDGSTDLDDAVRSKDLMIRQWRTSVCIAAKYSMPNHVMDISEAVKGGASRDAHDLHWSTSSMGLNQMVFRVDPNSKIYAQGQSNIEVPESTSFKGAQVLYNRGGESSIVIGLDSGLPHLKGYRFKGASYWNGGAEDGTAWDIVKWGEHDNFLYPDAFYHERMPDYMEEGSGYGNGDPESAEFYFRGFKYGLNPPDDAFDGYPMAWLVNLESAKTDVYNPFDKQELVWTGYYKAIEPRETTENNGDIDVIGLDTGECLDDYNNSTNYYQGGESGEIFGGDTYISRYAFRTTSHSYGHCYFRAARSRGNNLSDPGSSQVSDFGPVDNNKFHSKQGNYDRFQADLPDYLNPNSGQTFGKVNGMNIWVTDVASFDDRDDQFEGAKQLISNVDNWVQGDSNPQSTLFSFMVESDDNLGLRHKSDVEAGQTTKFFDADVAMDVLISPPTNDYTKQDKLLYEDHYSFLQDIRVAVPFPKRLPAGDDVSTFPTRVIRSKAAGGIIGDQFRQFLANDYKDMVKNRGEIWSLFTLGGMLYVHTERSLFRTQGKENLAVGDVTAFIGSGDIFAQEPMELRDTKNGYGGTTSVYGGVTTPYGRFYISAKDRKIYNVSGQGIEEVMGGMESWLRDNIPFQIEQLGIDPYSESFTHHPDATTGSVPMGFTMSYDPVYKRVLITKREPKPTPEFFKGRSREPGTKNSIVTRDQITLTGSQQIIYNNAPGGQALVSISDLPLGGLFVVEFVSDALIVLTEINLGDQTTLNIAYFTPDGWTLSYYPELKIWGSRHSYLPKLYVSTAESLFSYKDTSLWEHSDVDNPGNFYGTVYPFEVEFIDNSSPSGGNQYSALSYFADVKKRNSENATQTEGRTNPGFTSFYVYNTSQVSALSTNLNYLQNVRKVDGFWYINSFRDLAKYTTQTSEYINSGFENVVGGVTATIEAPISSEPMFTGEGVVNPEYLDAGKPWHMQKRFVDNFLGVRLSNDNSSTNLLYLYAAGTKFRKSNR